MYVYGSGLTVFGQHDVACLPPHGTARPDTPCRPVGRERLPSQGGGSRGKGVTFSLAVYIIMNGKDLWIMLI